MQQIIEDISNLEGKRWIIQQMALGQLGGHLENIKLAFCLTP